jgi:hypothetical protein
MTQTQKAIRRERHIVVDLLAIVGGAVLSSAVEHRNWLSIIGALAIIGLALWFDRRNARDEEANQ